MLKTIFNKQHATLNTGKDYISIRMTLDNENDFKIIQTF